MHNKIIYSSKRTNQNPPPNQNPNQIKKIPYRDDSIYKTNYNPIQSKIKKGYQSIPRDLTNPQNNLKQKVPTLVYNRKTSYLSSNRSINAPKSVNIKGRSSRIIGIESNDLNRSNNNYQTNNIYGAYKIPKDSLKSNFGGTYDQGVFFKRNNFVKSGSGFLNANLDKGDDRVVRNLKRKIEDLEKIVLLVRKQGGLDHKVEGLLEQIEKLNIKIQILREENRRLNKLCEENVVVEKTEVVREFDNNLGREDLIKELKLKNGQNAKLFYDLKTLQKRYKNLEVEYKKAPKLIKIEKIKRINTKIEPGDIKKLVDEERIKNLKLLKDIENFKIQIKNLENINHMNKTTADIFKDLKEQIREKDNLLEKYRNDLINSKKPNNKLVEEISNLKENLNEIKTNNAILNSKNEDYQLRILELKKSNNTENLQKKNKELENDLDSLKKELNMKTQWLDRKEDEIKNRERTISELSRKIQLPNNNSTNLEAELTGLKQLQDHSKNILEEKNFVISQYRDKIENYQKDIDRLRDDIKIVREDREDFAARKTQKINKDLEKSKTDLENLKNLADDNERELKKLKNDNFDLNDEVERLRKFKRENPEFKEKVVENHSNIPSSQEMSSLIDKLKNNDEEMIFFKNKLDQLNSKFKKVKKSENFLRKENENLSGKVKNLFEDKEKLQEMYQNNLKEFLQKEKDLDTTRRDEEDEKKDLERERRDLKDKNRDLENQNRNLSNDKMNLENQKRNLENEKLNLELLIKNTKNPSTDLEQIKREILNSMGNAPNSSKEYIKEVIEKNTNSSDLSGILKDIFYAIKDLNVNQEHVINIPSQNIIKETEKSETIIREEIRKENEMMNQNKILKDLNDDQNKKIVNLSIKLSEFENRNKSLEEKCEKIVNNHHKEIREIKEIHIPFNNSDNGGNNKNDDSELLLENEKLKKRNEELEIRFGKYNDNLIRKKRELLKELSNFVNSKNTFETSFYSELTKDSV